MNVLRNILLRYAHVVSAAAALAVILLGLLLLELVYRGFLEVYNIEHVPATYAVLILGWAVFVIAKYVFVIPALVRRAALRKNDYIQYAFTREERENPRRGIIRGFTERREPMVEADENRLDEIPLDAITDVLGPDGSEEAVKTTNRVEMVLGELRTAFMSFVYAVVIYYSAGYFYGYGARLRFQAFGRGFWPNVFWLTVIMYLTRIATKKVVNWMKKKKARKVVEAGEEIS